MSQEESDDLWPEYREVLNQVHPELERKTVFLGETHRGILATARVWDDYETRGHRFESCRARFWFTAYLCGASEVSLRRASQGPGQAPPSAAGGTLGP
jgi:hypothetical protein